MESDSEVRDACYAALGSAMRVIGEKPMNSLIADIVEDKLKMTKVFLETNFWSIIFNKKTELNFRKDFSASEEYRAERRTA